MAVFQNASELSIHGLSIQPKKEPVEEQKGEKKKDVRENTKPMIPNPIRKENKKEEILFLIFNFFL